MRGGWVSSTGTIERGGGLIRGIMWTDEGLRRSVAIAMLLQELEDAGGRFSDTELLCFRRLIKDHAP